MTTIAWDGSCLAVDRGAWIGRMAMEQTKLHLFPDGGPNGIPPGAWASTGSSAHIAAVRRWLWRQGEEPAPIVGEIENDMGLYVDMAGNCYHFHQRLVLTPIESRYAGGGGGGLFVLGAMAAGMNAVDAVHLAGKHTDASINGVDYWVPGVVTTSRRHA